ncbi:fumarylacetoacetate hydrolase family protein [Devosia algicola]|uniref:Fumarylacetoacetate hydrolase family protein n=1 Tax=Devosia algicola TaxID=3026418 RepID=A0ABY7YQF4_9HYPH|nr:fumarylacetoacetate hydrolase family protein [Devosia algicola]WDR03561.1 fumarylacetoacetate hydrolase family protein [Devosia algicola]
MKFVTFSANGVQHVGALDGTQVVDLTAAGIADTMLSLIVGGDAMLAKARSAVAGPGPRLDLAKVQLKAPVKPGKVLCSGFNYLSHLNENPTAVKPDYPLFFAKVSTAIAGPEDEIEAPKATEQLDYEVEFSVVIGKRLTRPSEAEVMPAIFGYTLLNDVSARDVQFDNNQITTGKNFDRFAPIGPCIVTTDEMPNPDSVTLKTRLNGRTLQDGNTNEWLFSLPRLVSYLAGIMTLEPGDIVTTGTPAGVGYFQKPQVYMKPGDVIEIEAEGIGVLRNRIVAQGAL